MADAQKAESTPSPDTEVLVRELEHLIEARRDFVSKRHAMNAAIPDPVTGTPAERALYDERYKADHEAERELHRAAQKFAEWATDNADSILSRLRTAQNTGTDEEIERIARAVMVWGQPHFKHMVSFNVLQEAIAGALKSSPPVSTVDEEGGGS